MDLFKQKRISSWLIVLLILLNVSTLYLLWSKEIKKPDRPAPQTRERSEKFNSFLREKLQFSANQIQEYEQYRDKHAEQTRKLMNQTHDLKQKLLNEIFNEEPDTTRSDKLAEEIGIRQTQIERITFSHFLDLKKLCGKEQQNKLRALIDDFHRKNRPPQQQPPRNRRGPEGPPPRERPRN
jgi:periplasmic protein CpxP/Spy